jgi:hypothetical protein
LVSDLPAREWKIPNLFLQCDDKNGWVGNELVAPWFSGIYIAPYFDTSMVSTIAVEVRRIKHKKRTEKMGGERQKRE